MNPVTIYWEKRAIVDCGCGHGITFPLDDLVGNPPPVPGDVVTCPRCRRQHEVVREELR